MGPIVVLDNGAATIKAGTVRGAHDASVRLVPNGVFRSKGNKTTYVGHELDRCTDFESLHHRLPFEKGFLVDWDAQKAVWDGLFSPEVLGVNPPESSLLITEPYFNLPNIQEVYDQLVFEEYEFASFVRCAPAALIPFGGLFADPALPAPQCTLVVDAGFSYTHVVPLIDGAVVWSAVVRIDVGGKLLTNHLKELVSYRQWNMMDETHVMNAVKEQCCFVTTDLARDLETCRVDPKQNAIVQEYVLPDFSARRHGHVRRAGEAPGEADQTLFMNNERFLVPELLFRPDDIGLDQCGLPAAIARAIGLLPADLRGMFWANIGLVGGSAKFPGFKARLMQELRPMALIDGPLVIYEAEDPITAAHAGALAFAQTPAFAQRAVTRAEYLECGASAARRRFAGWDWRPLSAEEEREPGRERTGAGASAREAGKGAREAGKGRSRARAPVQGQGQEEAEGAPAGRESARGKGKARAQVQAHEDADGPGAKARPLARRASARR